MPCSVCQQSGHNKRTCELNTKVATTGKYAGMTAVQIEAIFAERERKNYEELVAPIIAPKLACADCGQVETECRLERLVGGKVMCCDCLYPENQEDDDETVSVESEDTCECCGRPYDHRNPHRQSEMCDCVQNDDGTLSRPEEEVYGVCGDCGKEGKFIGQEGDDWTCEECSNIAGFNHSSDEDETDDEDLEVECEGCGGKFHDDDTLSTRYNRKYCEDCWENVPKELHPYIEGLDDEEEDRTRTSPTRDQLIALGKYKLAKFQIGKQDQRDETNWNEDGDDELCSAIDASGNALY
jgi:hypothetical protein